MLRETNVARRQMGYEPLWRSIGRVAPIAFLALLLVACGASVDEVGGEQTASLLAVSVDSQSVTPQELDGQLVTGTIRIVVEVNGRSVTEVRFHHNGASAPLEVDTTAPFELVLDTTLLEDGSHLIVAMTPSGRGGGVRELARAVFTVANDGTVGAPAPSDPTHDPELGPDPDPDLVPAPDPDPGLDPMPDPDPDSGTTPIDGITIAVGADVRAVVGSHPAGSTFVFASGVHRLTLPISPRAGDVFVGQPGAVLNGSRLLTSFTREGGLWVASGQTQQEWVHGSCVAEAPRCRHPEDLFIDDVPLRHVASLSEVGPGSWFFDYAADKIYFADDPAGRVVEASVATGAIVGDANDVTVRGLVIEKFASQAQRGAIMAIRYATSVTFGERWTIEGNTVRLNHGVGIKAGYGAHIVDNRVLMNGQLGIGGGHGPGTLVERNEIAYNNWAGFEWRWEAGGTKFVYSDGLVARDNHVHHNEGPGLWTDIDNIRTLYESNLVEHNANVGIFHEISYDAIIRNNVVRHNGAEAGLAGYAYVFGAGIMVSSSSNVQVYANVVEGNWNGIVGLHGDRGSGAHGVRELRNLHVHDNAVSLLYHHEGINARGERGVAALNGVVQNAGIDFVFSDAYNNRYDHNLYALVDAKAEHFSWRGTFRDFSAWQKFDQDLNGSIVVTSSTTTASP